MSLVRRPVSAAEDKWSILNETSNHGNEWRIYAEWKSEGVIIIFTRHRPLLSNALGSQGDTQEQMLWNHKQALMMSTQQTKFHGMQEAIFRGLWVEADHGLDWISKK